MDLTKALAEGRKRARHFEETERQAGLASPAQIGAFEVLACAIAAIEAGISKDDWTCVVDGLLLIEQLQMSVSGLRKHKVSHED